MPELIRHPENEWIPAFAGMTENSIFTLL